MENIYKKTAYISETSSELLRNYIRCNGYEVNILNSNDSTYYPVSSHPDIFMCKLGLWDRASIFYGDIKSLGRAYPNNIIYNAVCTDKYFIHNLKYTDEKLMEKVKSKASTAMDFKFVNVNQGYTRCCCLPVDDTSFITSDLGIARALTNSGANVLIIEKGHISLPGFDYGFIGGCAGHIIQGNPKRNSTTENEPTFFKNSTSIKVIKSEKEIVFNGNLLGHPDYNKIVTFIEDRGINTVFFEDFPLTDIGSIITLW